MYVKKSLYKFNDFLELFKIFYGDVQLFRFYYLYCCEYLNIVNVCYSMLLKIEIRVLNYEEFYFGL